MEAEVLGFASRDQVVQHIIREKGNESDTYSHI